MSSGAATIAHGLAPLTLRKAACYCTRVPAPVLLETDNLTRAYGSLLAVDRASMTVREGELRSIIGPNCAGKLRSFVSSPAR